MRKQTRPARYRAIAFAVFLAVVEGLTQAAVQGCADHAPEPPVRSSPAD